MTRRLLTGLAAAGLLVALTVGTAAAGGWATIQSDEGNPPQPNAGATFTFGFTVLQHGVTPAGWVEAPTFLGLNAATGERVEVKAVAQGADGHFVATVTLPSAGFWTWQIVLTDLIVETPPQAMAVAAADGTVPAMDSRAVVAEMERMRAEIRADYQAQLFTETDALRTQMAQLDAQVTYLENQREELRDQITALSAAAPSAAASPTTESMPLFAVIGLAILAGAISGFAMTALGRGGQPSPDAGIEEPAPATAVLTTR